LSAAEKADLIIEGLSGEKRFLAVFEWNRRSAYVFPHRSVLEHLAGAELAAMCLAEAPQGVREKDLVDRLSLEVWDFSGLHFRLIRKGLDHPGKAWVAAWRLNGVVEDQPLRGRLAAWIRKGDWAGLELAGVLRAAAAGGSRAGGAPVPEQRARRN